MSDMDTRTEREQARLADCIQRRRDGQTLAEIGAVYGVSRERIRQILGDRVSAEAVSDGLARRRRRQIREALDRPMTVGELADLVDMPRHVVNEHVDPDLRAFLIFPQASTPRHSDEDLLALLREAAEAVEGPLTAKAYTDLRATSPHPDRWPTVLTYANRFGSWSAALAAAGVEGGARPRSGYVNSLSEEQCFNAVRDFLATGARTAAAYDQWARGREGAPSLSRLRQRFGGWNDIKHRALA